MDVGLLVFFSKVFEKVAFGRNREEESESRFLRPFYLAL